MKELYLYFYVSAYMIAELLETMEEFKNKALKVRVNSPGGDVFRGWGFVIKLKEHKFRKEAIVDGYAASMAGVMLPFFDKVSVTNVSFIMIHRATAGDVSEDEGRRKMLDKTNKHLYDAFRQKVDEEKFEEVAGVSLKDLFLSPGYENTDIWLTGAEALEVKLADELIDITEESEENIENVEKNFTAVNKNILLLNNKPRGPKNSPERKRTETEHKTRKMDKAELKEKHPGVYNEIFAEGETKGVKVERDRVGAFAEFIESSPEKVKKAIKEGEEFNNTALAELSSAAHSTKEEKEIEDDSKTVKADASKTAAPKADASKKPVKPGAKVANSEDSTVENVVTEDELETEKKTEAVSSFEAEVKANLGLGKKD